MQHENGTADLAMHRSNHKPEAAEEKYFDFNIIPSHSLNGTVEGVIIYALEDTSKAT